MLPIHDIEKDLRASLKNSPSRFLLKAPTGSGKSTTVPSIVQAAISERDQGKILVIQPRRMACRLLAEYVSTLEKSPLGQKVGYTVRFENKSSSQTKILFITDGILQRILLDNPDLEGISAVIFDEFHERRLASDLSLARILELQEQLRPDLHLGVMSATLKVAGLEKYLAPCTMLETGGRLHSVEITHRAPDTTVQKGHNQRREKKLWDHISDAVRDEAFGQPDGTRILCFLPGTHEIRKTQQCLERISALKDWEIAPLYSALPPARQKEAITPSSSRRIILSTNVAETSLTIEGVTIVIDSGLHRTNLFDPRRGIDSLRIEKISRASADQRAGRAGRTAPGRAIRLWSQPDHQRRAAFDPPEVHRVDLAEAVLFLKRLGYKTQALDSPLEPPQRPDKGCNGALPHANTNPSENTPQNLKDQPKLDDKSSRLSSSGGQPLAADLTESANFNWLDAPPADMLAQSLALLTGLGALDSGGDITELGYEMSRWPLHPRLARLMMAGIEEDCLAETAFIAAAISSEGIFKKGSSGKGGGTKWRDYADRQDQIDFAAEWNALQSARHANFHPGQCNTLGLLARGARETDKAHQQFLRLLEKQGQQPAPVDFQRREVAILKALLLTFSDRLASRYDSGSAICHLIGADGLPRTGKLDPQSVAKKSTLFIATDIIEVEGRERTVHLSRCATISEELLSETFPGELQEQNITRWDEISRRMTSNTHTSFRGLTLAEKSSGQLTAAHLSPEIAGQAARILAQKALKGELPLKKWDKSVETFINRINFLTQQMPELELPTLQTDDQLSVLEEICLDDKQGGPCLSYRDLKERDPWPVLNDWLSAPQSAALDAYAPQKITLENDRSVKIRYPSSSSEDLPIEPTIDIKPQHLFGVSNTPVIANDYPLLLKILAPNQRPYQTTKDLPNFWKSGFLQMKKDLAGRYPKHQWDLPE